MSELPYFTFAQQRAAYLALGLDKALLNDTTRIVLEPGHMVVERLHRKDGKFYLADEDTIASYDQAHIRATRRSYARKQRRR